MTRSSPEHAFDEARQHYQAGRLAAAQEMCQQILSQQSDHADALHLLGILQCTAGQADAGAALLRRAVQLKPQRADYHCNLGRALSQLGQREPAIAAYRQSLVLQPDFLDASRGLTMVLRDAGRMQAAIEEYHRMLALRPDCAEFHSDLGNTLIDVGCIDEACACYQRAMALGPDEPTTRSNWLYALHLVPDQDAAAIFQQSVAWDRQFGQPLRYEIPRHGNDPNPGRRLKIGYVSPDFHMHSVAFFMENLLASHDPAQVEVFCYSDVVCPDEVTARLRKASHQWRNTVGVADAQLAQIIIQDRIDILVDLAGHTAGNRLLVFARKPAPVQVTYLGYPATTGLSTMDYRFTDAYADPPGTTEAFHTEQLMRLPQNFATYLPPADAPPVAPLPALARGYLTFGGFATLAKVSPTLLDCWGRILSQVRDSRLVMAANGLGDAPTRQRILDALERRGIAPQRLVLLDRQSLADYLALHRQVDLLLDTFPVNGHTVTCHALWMGVPPVTLAGKMHGHRLGASLLHNLGLPCFIAGDSQEYVQIAVRAATDLGALAELRAGLRARMRRSPLMDASHFAREVEAAYRQMWRRWCDTKM